MKYNRVNGRFFMGNEISPYGLKNGRVDYATLAKSFQKILANDIIQFDAENWELISGFDNGDYWEAEIAQFYLVDEAGAEILQNWTNEFLMYNEHLNLYLWGVSHYGTAWNYVLTDIECEKVEDIDV